MAAQQREAVLAVDPQCSALESRVGQRHPAGLVERVGAVRGLALPAYGGHDRERILGVLGVDADDAQDRCSAGASSAAEVAAGVSLDGSTKR